MDTLRVRARCAQHGIKVGTLKDKESKAKDKPNKFLKDRERCKRAVLKPFTHVDNRVDIKVSNVLKLVLP